MKQPELLIRPIKQLLLRLLLLKLLLKLLLLPKQLPKQLPKLLLKLKLLARMEISLLSILPQTVLSRDQVKPLLLS